MPTIKEIAEPREYIETNYKPPTLESNQVEKIYGLVHEKKAMKNPSDRENYTQDKNAYKKTLIDMDQYFYRQGRRYDYNKHSKNYESWLN